MEKSAIEQSKKELLARAIVKSPISRLSEIVRMSELIISVQIDSFRAIDSRATHMMTSCGVLLSILFGTIGLLGVNDKLQELERAKIFIPLAILSGMFSIAPCLRVIQSDKFNPPGNNGRELLKDIADGFSEREEKIDYIYNLSVAHTRNEKLISRNGKLLKLSSFSFLMMLIFIILVGYQLF